MEARHYEIDITASPTAVRHTLLDTEHYVQWIKVFSAQPTFTGKWGKGEQMPFYDPTMEKIIS